MRLQRLTPDSEWAAGLVASLPSLWRRDMLSAWKRAHGQDRTAGNLAHLKMVKQVEAIRIPLEATDADLIDAANKLAERCFELAGHHHDAAYLEESMRKLCKAQGVEPPDVEKTTHQGAIARMTSPMWWRRRLRRMHGRAVEAAAIKLGRVSMSREIYASTATVQRRAQQRARNEATLESTIATNELGQEFTLAELAAKGTANKAIRRAELMTRIAGFERIARDSGHEGLFATITCPSRMHRMHMVGPKWARYAAENGKYDGTTPREANQYLGKVFSRIRAALARKGIGIYGFRISEPQHDGTPHWHLLVFVEAGTSGDVEATFRRYALQDCGDEQGALAHRVDFEKIDWERGSAAAYIAKYVAKNIDGYRVGEDLYGNPALETSARVEAWATTWGIRQFQQVGGPPVGPWRELRRVKEMPDEAPEAMREAWNAVNKLTQLDGHPEKSVAWDRYTRAQGGVFCGRKYRVRVSMRDRSDQLNAYGEPAQPVPCGVETVVREIYTPEHMKWMGGKAERSTVWHVASERHTWQIKRASKGVAIEGVSMGSCAAWTPRTCVNNCTEGVCDGEVFSGAVRNRSDSASGGVEGGKEGHGWHESDGQGRGRACSGTDLGCRDVPHGRGGGSDASGNGRNDHEPHGGWVEGSPWWLQGNDLHGWMQKHH